MNRDEVLQAVLTAVERANALRPPDGQIPQREDTALFGEGGHLDSLGLVSLVLDVEDLVNEATGRSLVLSDDRAMSQSRSPFRTVGDFVEYVALRLQGPDM
jgi:acyl carrier protein